MGQGQEWRAGALLPSTGSCAAGAAGRTLWGASAPLHRDGSADEVHVIAPARKQPHVAQTSASRPHHRGAVLGALPPSALLWGLVAASLPPELEEAQTRPAGAGEKDAAPTTRFGLFSLVPLARSSACFGSTYTLARSRMPI